MQLLIMTKIKCPYYKYEDYDDAPDAEAFFEEDCTGEIELKDVENGSAVCPECGRSVEIFDVRGEKEAKVPKSM